MSFWRVLKDGRPLRRPVTATTVHDARRRVLASLGMELEGISEDAFNLAERASLATGGLPAISEACEPNERREGDAPCFGEEECSLREKCANWLHRARGLEPRL